MSLSPVGPYRSPTARPLPLLDGPLSHRELQGRVAFLPYPSREDLSLFYDHLIIAPGRSSAVPGNAISLRVGGMPSALPIETLAWITNVLLPPTHICQGVTRGVLTKTWVPMGAQNDLLAQSEQVLYDVTGIWCVDPTADSAVQEQQKAALAAYCEDLAQNRIGPIDPRLPRRPMIFERIAPPPPPAGFPAFAGSPGRA